MRTLRYRRPLTAIKQGDKIVVGFGFPDLPFSYNIRDYGELRALFKKNPALVRNMVAHYLRVCGLSTAQIGQFLDISPSRVSSASTKGWRDIYPLRRRREYTSNRSYVSATSQLETRRWNSGILEFRSRSPRDAVELTAHLTEQAAEEIVDAEDALRHFNGFDERRLVAAAFEVGRAAFRERQEALGDAVCPCSQCNAFRAQTDTRTRQAAELDEDLPA